MLNSLKSFARRNVLPTELVIAFWDEQTVRKVAL